LNDKDDEKKWHPYMKQRRQPHLFSVFLMALFKHKGKILTVFVAAAITMMAVSTLRTLGYDASSVLIVTFGSGQPNRSAMDAAGPPTSLRSEESTNAAMEMLQSRELIEKTISAIGVEKIYPDLVIDPLKNSAPPETAILRFEKNLSAESVDTLNGINVSFQHRNPQIAADGVNRLVEIFKEMHNRPPEDSRVSSLEKQLPALRQNLKASEDDLRGFQEQQDPDSFGKQRRNLLKQRAVLDAFLQNAESRIFELQKKLSSLTERRGTVVEDIPPLQETEREMAIDENRAQLQSLEEREKNMLATLKETSPPVVHIRSEIEQVKQLLEDLEKDTDREVVTGKTPTNEALERQIAETKTEVGMLSGKVNSMKKNLAGIEADMGDLNRREEEFSRLKRDVAHHQSIYQEHEKKMEEVKSAFDREKQKMVSATVIQKAAVPSIPVIPQNRATILLAIFAGACSGLVVAFVFSHLEAKLLTPESAEKHLGLPVLTIISYKESMGGHYQ
jgi:uncharacterized protein involved in exopolysaccharide biosynthesis